jgi:hypothetical protein
LAAKRAPTANASRANAPAIRAIVRSGSLLNVHVDVVAFNDQFERLQGNDGGQSQRLAGSHVERRAVARADDVGAFEGSLIESPAVVRANVFDGV